ncbi:DUF1302 family protein [Microbulbifer sp. ALW1]|uniref:DUF1302 family protein n=1 Tax=Microbulbifer sp. (strain ALW1) TaxID=1516059 RepID=UPI00135A2A74|nr:DUF1302 family protein [Microbulbifer sp. ALW1]
MALVSSSCAASMRIGGIVSATHAVQTTDGTPQKSELVILPQLEWRSANGVDVTAIGRIRVDGQNQLEPGEPDQAAVDAWSRRAFLGAHTEVELREFYLEAYPFGTYLKLGKQQIVWGQTDGLKVLDRVNPQRYREFILEDFESSRIPLWAAKWEFSMDTILNKDWDGQLILIPDQTYHEVPAAGASYAPTSPELVVTPPAGSIITGYTFEKPDRVLADADAGLQLSSRLHGWDLTVNYLYHYADTPVMRLYQENSGMRIHGSYERTHTIGGSASNAFGDFTLRSEMGYTTDRHIQTNTMAENNGVVRGGELSYALGLDWMGLSDTLVSAQLIQSWFDRDGVSAYRDTIETDATLLIEHTFLNEVLTLSNLLIHDIDSGDGLLSTELTYDYLANLELRIEANMFYGSQYGRYGQFDARDRLLVGFEYGF